MRKIIIFILLVIVLTSCAPVERTSIDTVSTSVPAEVESSFIREFNEAKVYRFTDFNVNGLTVCYVIVGFARDVAIDCISSGG